MKSRNKWVSVLLWGQFIDVFIVALSGGLDIIEVIEIQNPLLFLGITFGLFAIITFFRQGLLTNILNEKTPVVTINSDIEKKSLSYFAGTIQYELNYAIVEFSNNPKSRSPEAIAKNVYTKVSYFLSDLTPLYQNLDGLWFPYKNEEPSNTQVRENGETELLPTGRKERLMIALKRVGQDPPVVIENCKEYFSGIPFGSDTEYYERHFLLHDKKYYVLIELSGTRLAENYIFELWEKGDRLFFNQIEDKKLCKKIISAKKN